MNRLCLGSRRYYLCGLFTSWFSQENVHDIIDDSPEFIPQNAFEKVIHIFQEKIPGEPSEAAISLIQLGFASFFAGTLVGGAKAGKKAQEHFLIANQHSKFVTAYEGKRKLHDVVFLNFFKGGFKWGAKAACFTVMYSFCVLVIPLWRGKDGFIEFPIGGALAGALARSYLGLKATLAGGVIGGLFASFVGAFVLLTSKFANVSMADVRNMQYDWYKRRQEAVAKANWEVAKDKLKQPVPSYLEARELLLQKRDTDGYSETDPVYFVVPSPEKCESSTLPVENNNENFNSDERNDSSSVIDSKTKTSVD